MPTEPDLFKEPNFFKDRRVSVYFKGGRMMKDKKTDQRFWRLKWAVTVRDEEANSCGGAMLSNYRQMQKRENGADRIELAGAQGGMTAKVFESDKGPSKQVIFLPDCYKRTRRIIRGMRVLNKPELRRSLGMSDDLAGWLKHELMFAAAESLGIHVERKTPTFPAFRQTLEGRDE